MKAWSWNLVIHWMLNHEPYCSLSFDQETCYIQIFFTSTVSCFISMLVLGVFSSNVVLASREKQKKFFQTFVGLSQRLWIKLNIENISFFGSDMLWSEICVHWINKTWSGHQKNKNKNSFSEKKQPNLKKRIHSVKKKYFFHFENSIFEKWPELKNWEKKFENYFFICEIKKVDSN